MHGLARLADPRVVSLGQNMVVDQICVHTMSETLPPMKLFQGSKIMRPRSSPHMCACLTQDGYEVFFADGCGQAA